MGVACIIMMAAEHEECEDHPPSKRKKLAPIDGDLVVGSLGTGGGRLTSDAHLSKEKIQSWQLAKQPFNIWHGRDEPDINQVVARVSCDGSSPVAEDSFNPTLPTVPFVPTGRGTTVAILDSGINASHTAFREEGGFKISVHSRSFIGGDATDIVDTLGHGTQCAGLLCGSADTIALQGTNKTLPFCGIAPNAQVMVCKVVQDGEAASIEAVCKAIDYIRDYNQSCASGNCTDSKVSVISLSFGMTGFHSKLTSKIQEALYDGVIVVCAASNNGKKIRQPITYPARLGDVLCIGACTANGKPADFSPVGRELDFLAHGETIWAPTVGGDRAYDSVNGTSFAAPLVAGIVCCVIEDLRRLSEAIAGNGAPIWERMHNVWCMRELLKEMASREHSGESGYGMLNPTDYFERMIGKS